MSTVLNSAQQSTYTSWMFYGCVKLPYYSLRETNCYNAAAAKPQADGGVFWGAKSENAKKVNFIALHLVIY